MLIFRQDGGTRLDLIPGKGRGVLAQRAFMPGDLIETAPTVELSVPDCQTLETTPLGDYYFAHPENIDAGCLIFGLTSFLNHSDAPNAQIEWRHDETGWRIDLYAIAEIPEGAEITRTYVCAPWFDVH